jgi:DNA-binding transcriptional MerR regulator
MSERPLHLVGAERETADEHGLTIEQLAAETELTVRNIRSHRARGLLQPPVVRDRVGYYGPEHVARLKLVRELQAEGFNLAAIKRLVEGAPGPPDQILSAIRLAHQPFETEEPQIVTEEELARRFDIEDPARAIERAEELGMLVELGEGRYESPAPSLLEAAEEIVSRGVPIHHALAVVAKVRESCRTVAREFVRLFVDDVLRPFEAEGLPAERWPEIVEAIERLRPMSAQVVLAVYQLTMTREVEGATAREFERLMKRAPK